MSRIRERFAQLRAEGRRALVLYLTEGDPSHERTVELVQRLAEAGADVIELGVPFSDPTADGPVIAAAMQRALRGGASLRSALSTVRELRDLGCRIPVVLFGYCNPVFIRGAERFADECANAEVDAVLQVDLPLDEIDELRVPLSDRNVEMIPLVAPTTDLDRCARLAQMAPPFVYYISRLGTTGSAYLGAAGGAQRIREIRQLTKAPVAVGFGIKTPEDVREVGAFADGVVVGSELVRRISEAQRSQDWNAIDAYIRSLRASLDALEVDLAPSAGDDVA